MNQEELNRWIKKNNLSKNDAAIVFGVSRSTIYRMTSESYTLDVCDNITNQCRLFDLLNAKLIKSEINKRLNEHKEYLAQNESDKSTMDHSGLMK